MDSDPPSPTDDPTTIKINFPLDFTTKLDSLLQDYSNKDEIMSEAMAALGDTISKFSSHLSSPANMWIIFDAMREFAFEEKRFFNLFNYTNQVALILDRTLESAERTERITELIRDFKTNVDFADKLDQLEPDVAKWVLENGDKITPIYTKLLQIVLEKVGFPLQQKSWARAIQILQNGNFILLPPEDENIWLIEVETSLLNRAPSDLDHQGRTEFLTLLQLSIRKSLNMKQFKDLVKKILKVSNDKTVRILIIKVILKAVQLYVYSPMFVIPVKFLKMMREISPIAEIVNFTEVMMSYVREILENCKVTRYVEKMVKILSFQDLEGLFIGDVVNGVVAMTTSQLHPIDSKVYAAVFKVLRKNNGKLALTAKSAEQLLTSAKNLIEPDNLDKFALLVFQLIEICVGSDQNFSDADAKNKFMSDCGTLFKNLLITAVEVADKKMMSATVEKFYKSISTQIGLDLWINLLKNEQFDDTGTLANSILANISFSDETWDSILNEVVWKETPSREDNIYRGLVTLASNSKFPRSRVVDVVKHRYCELTLNFFIAWINNKKNEKITQQVGEVLKHGTKYEEWMNQNKPEDFNNLSTLLSKFKDFTFLKDAPSEIKLFYELHKALVFVVGGETKRMKGVIRFHPVYWLKWMAWQIIFVFGVNIGVDWDLKLIDKVDRKSVGLGVKLLLELREGSRLVFEEAQVKIIKLQLDELKRAEWVTEEIKGDIRKVQDMMGRRV